MVCLFLLRFSCSVWDIESGTEVAAFANGNEAGKVTALEFLNPHDLTYLMAGTGELLLVCACVRVCILCKWTKVHGPSALTLHIVYLSG